MLSIYFETKHKAAKVLPCLFFFSHIVFTSQFFPFFAELIPMYVLAQLSLSAWLW